MKPQRRYTEPLKDNEPPEHWHVEKKIPLALIFAMAVQTVCLIAFLAQLDGRVGRLEKDSEAKNWQAERIIRIDERLTSLQTSMLELKAIMRGAPAPTPVPRP